MSRHTPGPWEVKTAELDKDYIRVRGTVPGGEFKIANVPFIRDHIQHFTKLSQDNAEANARLIAASPELLAELEHAHDMIKHYLKMGYLPHLSAEEAEQLVRNPDSAIRKARGEQ